jgi:hypothetical protein
VDITGTDEGKVVIHMQKRIWRKNEEDAKKVADELRMIVSQEGEKLVIATNRNEFRKKRFETSFSISAPAGTDIKVENSHGRVKAADVGEAVIYNSHGEVSASGIAGNLTLENSYEDVDIQNVGLGCVIKSRHADVTARDILGKIQVFHSYGKVYLENIGEDVSVEGSHSEIWGKSLAKAVEVESSYEKIYLADVGPAKIVTRHAPVEVDGARELLEINDSYDIIKLNNIQGRLIVDGRSLEVSGQKISGSEIYISTSHQDVNLSEFSGKTTIYLSHGNLSLQPLPLEYPVQVKAEYADIRFLWPQGERYPVEARSTNGNVRWLLSESPSVDEKNGYSLVKAFSQEQGKPTISLATTHGNIRIEEFPIK